MALARIRLSIFTLFVLLLQNLAAQDSLSVYSLDDDIIITATRIPTVFNDVARTVTTINQEYIKNTAAQSVPELLEAINGIDVQQRGTQGIQADISIRGAGFEQTLILINGLKISDPQTGHHNMNLPIHISDIERIEILKGPGSRLYGPNAFGGVINIITKKTDKARAAFGGLFGEYNIYDSYVNLIYPYNDSGHRLTIAKSGSDGYRPNTDYNGLVFSHNSYLKFDDHELEVTSGYNEKKFGANSFYTTRFPEQYEETRLQYFESAFHANYTDFSIKPQAYYRIHRDKFRLIRNNPAFYENNHKSYSYGIDLQGHWNNAIGTTLFGGEWAEEEIKSNNLGNHLRKRNGLFLQQQLSYKPIHLAIGVSTYYFTNEGWQSWPGLDASFTISPQSKFYFSMAEGFRVPTYTELYYRDAATRGNKDLQPEESINYELGFSWLSTSLEINLALFTRTNENLIDYVFEPTDSLFYAQNFTEIKTDGLEAGIRLNNPGLGIKSVFTNYSYLNSDVNLSGNVTRYTLTHFKHQFIIGGTYKLAFLEGLSQSWKLKYEERLSPAKNTTLDTRINWQNDALRLYLDISNILDEKYEDIPGVPMPGRWLKLGFEYNLIN